MEYAAAERERRCCDPGSSVTQRKEASETRTQRQMRILQTQGHFVSVDVVLYFFLSPGA